MLWDGILNPNSPIFCRFQIPVGKGNFKPFWHAQKKSWRSWSQNNDLLWSLYYLDTLTLQGINMSHLGKRKIIFNMPFWRDMLVPWRVVCHHSSPISKNTPTTNWSLPLVCFHQDTDPTPKGGCLCATLTDDELRHLRHRRRERTNNFGWWPSLGIHPSLKGWGPVLVADHPTPLVGNVLWRRFEQQGSIPTRMCLWDLRFFNAYM